MPRPMLGAPLGAIAIAIAIVLASSLGAQDVPADVRLDRPTRDSLQAMLASAKEAGLPSLPLIRKIREGEARGADGARIVVVVRGYLRALDEGREALGTATSAEELDAAAAALRAGATVASLRAIRAQRASGRATVALVVLTDLLSRGITVERAAIAVGETLRADRYDATILAMRAEVARSSPSLDPDRASASLDRFLEELGRTSPRSERAQP